MDRCVDVPDSREPVFQQGRLADIVFFLRQVEQGARNGNFSNSFLNPHQQFLLIRRCCLALLWQALSLWPRRSGDRFLVMKVHGAAVAAMLLKTIADGPGRYIVGIDYLVVDAPWRRCGLGRQLVQRAIDEAPADSGFVCFCAPRSKGMQRLLRRLGFSRRVRAGMVDGVVCPHAFELLPESVRTSALATSAYSDMRLAA